DGIIDFRPHIAVILNITPDHLDRYNNSMPAYVGSKMRIAGNQHEEDYLIHCADDDQIISAMAASKPRSRKIPFSIYKKKYEGAYLKFPLKNPLEGLGLHRDNEFTNWHSKGSTTCTTAWLPQ
ncbi:MAG: Mur ligase family protein, partial [Flavobacteriales bacterium]